MARKRPRHKKVIDVPAGSERGQEALRELTQQLQDEGKIPTEKLSAGYDGPTKSENIRKIDLKLRTTPVALAIPFDEIVFGKWVVNFLGLRIMPWDDILTSFSTYLPDARNICHSHYVNDSQSPWLVMLDSDVMPPPDFIARLLAHEKKMVGGWYRVKGHPYQPVVYDYAGVDAQGIPEYRQRENPGEGLEKVDAAGAGCWLMAREVAMAIGEKPYHMAEGGEDLLLCRKVQEAGFDIFIDWSIACAHTGVAIV